MMQPCARKYTWTRGGSFETVHLVIIKSCGWNNPSRRRFLHSFGSWNFIALANLLHIWCQDQQNYPQIILPCPRSYHILLYLYLQVKARFLIFLQIKSALNHLQANGNNWCCAMRWERWTLILPYHRSSVKYLIKSCSERQQIWSSL